MPVNRRSFTQDTAGEISGGQSYTRCRFEGLRLARARLEECRFSHCTFNQVDLTDARLNASVFHTCQFAEVRLAGCNLFSTTFEECRLLGLDFSDHTHLLASKFLRCILDFASFRGCDLTGMPFDGSSLIEADLARTNLSKASFQGCNLAQVDWFEAVFGETDLRGANLAGLDLKVHNLRGAIITPAQFGYLADALGLVIVEG